MNTFIDFHLPKHILTIKHSLKYPQYSYLFFRNIKNYSSEDYRRGY
jgi:hypothetical protein